MKAKIIRADFKNEWDSKYGMMYNHTIEYEDKSATYCSKKRGKDLGRYKNNNA